MVGCSSLIWYIEVSGEHILGGWWVLPSEVGGAELVLPCGRVGVGADVACDGRSLLGLLSQGFLFFLYFLEEAGVCGVELFLSVVDDDIGYFGVLLLGDGREVVDQL